jgi:ketosteroid isomerase-like protein
MPEESTTPDLVDLTRRAYELSSDGDFDALLALFDSDACGAGRVPGSGGNSALL